MDAGTRQQYLSLECECVAGVDFTRKDWFICFLFLFSYVWAASQVGGYNFIQMQSLVYEPESDPGNKREENSESHDKMEEL